MEARPLRVKRTCVHAEWKDYILRNKCPWMLTWLYYRGIRKCIFRSWKTHNRTGGKCVVDSAFSRARYRFMIKSGQDELLHRSNSITYRTMCQATSARQSAEWGMRALQGSFPRLKDRMYYEEWGKRRLILLSVVLMFNHRTSLIGLNQLISIYMPQMEFLVNDLFEL